MAEAGSREGPAANTEVALTYLHTDCDTALVDNITKYKDSFIFVSLAGGWS